MRSYIARGGIVTFITEEEHALLEKIGEKVYKKALDEREAEVATILTRRGILERYKDESTGIYYITKGNLIE